MLFNSIQSAQNGDQNEMLYLISRFQSVICKYGRKLNRIVGNQQTAF